MKKIHLDTDLGGDTDDLCALALLLKWPDIEITGITTAAEDNGQRAGYTKYALKLAGRDEIPVAAGADFSLGGYHVTPGYPPHEEMWPEPIPPAPNPFKKHFNFLKEV